MLDPTLLAPELLLGLLTGEEMVEVGTGDLFFVKSF